MKRFSIIGPAIAALLAYAAPSHAADSLLNASYDVSRELFVKVNKAFMPAIRA